MATETVAVVAFNKNRVLLVKHLDGAENQTNTYGLPAGRRHDKEPHKQTGKRELEEETELIAELEDLYELPVEYFAIIARKNKKERLEMKVLYCKKYTGSLKPSEETFPEWVLIKKLHSLKLLPNVLNAIKEALAFKKKLQP